MQGEAHRALQSIIARQDIRVDFPPAVLAEIRAIQRAPGIDDPSLTDLTRIPFVTIDYTESRDLDQAMHIQREGDGFLVRYALADAAHYVRPDSALFAEALELLRLEPLSSDRADERLRDQVIAAANSGKDRQQRVEKLVMGAFIDQLLTGDLEQAASSRPARRGTIVGVNPNRLYVLLDEPLVDLKVYLEGSWELQEEVALVGPDRRFTLGDVVHIRTQDRDSRGRWRLVPVRPPP